MIEFIKKYYQLLLSKFTESRVLSGYSYFVTTTGLQCLFCNHLFIHIIPRKLTEEKKRAIDRGKVSMTIKQKLAVHQPTESLKMR